MPNELVDRALKPMSKTPSVRLRVIIAVVALFGLLGVLPVTLTEFSAGGACPHLGALPACHLVSTAYGAVLITVLHNRLWSPWLFLVAWLPIFALAVTGSGLELMGYGTCPKSASGLPKCFFSLGLAVALLMPFLIHIAKSKRIEAQRL